ncbi:MAG: lytic transglycosylase domain-containing protein [Bacteroidetes bacterium]|nr:lytic transglycosylase domain-containing protein [Bacteroidota bacterium]
MKGTIFTVVISVLLTLNLILLTSSKNDPIPPTPAPTSITELNKYYKIFPVEIPAEATFAGESVPLDIFDVRERLDRELLINTYWHSSTIYHFKQANRWFPVIEPILKENNIPDDFKYLALAESGLQNKVSPSRAEGVWQFLKGTGKEYGLQIENAIDERYHIEKATAAACQYLQEAYDTFGSWTMAAAAYNKGMPGMKKQVARQKETKYYDLLLNEETSRYIFRILALKEVLLNPEQYGFFYKEKDLYQPLKYKTFTIDSPIADLADFAKENGTNYKTLKILNPWLRDTYLKNDKRKEYTIKIPLKN